MPKLAASVSWLYQEVDLLDRFELAARAGFRAVEIQQPYSEPASAIARELARHDLSAELLNLPAALAAIPGRESEFREALTRALEYADATGCPRLHCLAGRSDDPAAEATFIANLNRAATHVDRLGVRLMLEPLNTRDNPGYFLTGSAQARRIIDQVDGDHVALQFDFYHIQIMEGSLAETMRAQAEVIDHFQISGVPGRNEPDAQQEINYPYLLDLIDESPYEGWVGCEYRPRAGTVEGLGWARPYGIEAGG
jgi:hydroxypyruvate isomerase